MRITEQSVILNAKELAQKIGANHSCIWDWDWAWVRLLTKPTPCPGRETEFPRTPASKRHKIRPAFQKVRIMAVSPGLALFRLLLFSAIISTGYGFSLAPRIWWEVSHQKVHFWKYLCLSNLFWYVVHNAAALDQLALMQLLLRCFHHFHSLFGGIQVGPGVQSMSVLGMESQMPGNWTETPSRASQRALRAWAWLSLTS